MKIGFIIVVYNQVFYETSTYQTLLKSLIQSDFNDYNLFIYDNSDKKEWKIDFENLQEKRKIVYYHDTNNSGVSIAYNVMASKASYMSIDWIVLLDQDTTLPLNLLSYYLDAISNFNGIFIKAPLLYVDKKLLSPCKFVMKRGITLRKAKWGVLTLYKYAFVNSGVLIKLDFFEKVGGYNEKIKLDYADFQFIEKVRKYTDCFEILPVMCFQNFSQNETNITKALHRYSIYNGDLHNCSKEGNLIEKLFYQINLLLHTIKLSMRHKSFQFLSIYIKNI